MRLSFIVVFMLAFLSALEIMETDARKRNRKNRKNKNRDKDKRPRRALIPGKFRNDSQVRRYLKLFGTDIMIWRCRNAITETYDQEPIPFIELYCEVLGSIKKIEWYHNFKKIKMDGKRHLLISFPHFYKGRYFFKWTDLLLRIPKATQEDSGIYTIKVNGRSGQAEEHTIFVNIAQRDKDPNSVVQNRNLLA